jgi:hypothetical protein
VGVVAFVICVSRKGLGIDMVRHLVIRHPCGSSENAIWSEIREGGLMVTAKAICAMRYWRGQLVPVFRSAVKTYRD